MLCFIQIIGSCSEKTWPFYKIDAETKEYCEFLPGSYWIYQEVSSGELDTVEIIAYSRKENDVTDSDGFKFISIYMRSIYSSEGYMIGGRPNFLISGDFYSKSINQSVVFEEINSGGGPLYYSFSKVGQSKSLNGHTIELISMDSNWTNGLNKYFDVKVFGREYGGDPSTIKTIYWAKNIGRIRWSNYAGEIWNLIEYNVKQ